MNLKEFKERVTTDKNTLKEKWDGNTPVKKALIIAGIIIIILLSIFGVVFVGARNSVGVMTREVANAEIYGATKAYLQNRVEAIAKEELNNQIFDDGTKLSDKEITSLSASISNTVNNLLETIDMESVNTDDLTKMVKERVAKELKSNNTVTEKMTEKEIIKLSTTIAERTTDGLDQQINALDLVSNTYLLQELINKNKSISAADKEELLKLIEELRNANNTNATDLTDAYNKLMKKINELDLNTTKTFVEVTNNLTENVNKQVQYLEKKITDLNDKLEKEVKELTERIEKDENLSKEQKEELIKMIEQLRMDSDQSDEEILQKLDDTKNNLMAYIEAIKNTIWARLGNATESMTEKVMESNNITDEQKTELVDLIAAVKDASAATTSNNDVDKEHLNESVEALHEYIDNNLSDEAKKELNSDYETVSMTVSDQLVYLEDEIDAKEAAIYDSLNENVQELYETIDEVSNELQTNINNNYDALKAYTDEAARLADENAKNYANNAYNTSVDYTNTVVGGKFVTLRSQMDYNNLVNTGSGTDINGNPIKYDATTYYFVAE